MKARDIDDAESHEFYVEAIAQVPEKKHNVKHMLQFQGPVWICNMSFAKPKVASWTLSSSVELVNGEFVAIHLRRHGGASGSDVISSDSFLLIVGMHKDYPIICTAHFLDHYWASYTYKLALENSRHVCDYYRKASCCGNVFEVALRKSKGADHIICWKAEITLENPIICSKAEITVEDPTGVYGSPSTCYGYMKVDIAVWDIFSDT